MEENGTKEGGQVTKERGKGGTLVMEGGEAKRKVVMEGRKERDVEGRQEGKMKEI